MSTVVDSPSSEQSQRRESQSSPPPSAIPQQQQQQQQQQQHPEATTQGQQQQLQACTRQHDSQLMPPPPPRKPGSLAPRAPWALLPGEQVRSFMEDCPSRIASAFVHRAADLHGSQRPACISWRAERDAESPLSLCYNPAWMSWPAKICHPQAIAGSM